ncbi:AGAP002837-PA [Anopheles gambiae str. PEST]|uniref:AGAP002837-PA n=1 Tax=Anopheles gambiae TaxID=7165 RepID=A7USS8_ANOGA|nr:cyclin-dependent kinase 2-associated protein 1 [Anopheles gambiae]EDO64213.2 AGAP002837-PA [Anopheles gambiae str. PEST]
MDYVDIQAVESKLTDVTVTPIPMIKNAHTNHSTGGGSSSSSNYGANHTANITITPQVNHRNSHNNSNHHHHSSVSGAVNDGSSGALALTVGSNHSNSNNNNANSSSSSNNNSSAANLVAPVTTFNQFPNNAGLSKYAQLLMVIEEMGRDLRPTYSGSRNSAERLKRLIVHARILVRECLVETERSARQ